MNKLVGNIGVDAGMCWIGDPCYVLPDDGSGRDRVRYWDLFCKTMQNKDHFSWPGLGVCVRTGHGDGVYPVIANIEDGVVKSVTVKFVEE